MSGHLAPTSRLTHAGARAAVEAGLGEARRLGVAACLAVVDGGGHLLVLERLDGGRFHSVHSATTKATTAASSRRPTGMQGAAGQALDAAHALGLALAAGPERWTAMEGGVPILSGGECVGAVGVSGGDWEQDVAIARAAVLAVEMGGRDG